MPKSPQSVLRAFLIQRFWMKIRNWDLRQSNLVETSEDTHIRDDLARIDIAWDAMMGLINVDQMRGALFHSYSLSMALRVGEPFRIGRALAMEAISLAAFGADFQDIGALMDRASQIADKIDHPYLRAFHIYAWATLLLLRGQWLESHTKSRCATERFRKLPGNTAWERSTAEFIGFNAQLYVGIAGKSRTDIETSIKQAKTHGNRYQSSILQSGIINTTWLIDDDVEEARRQATDAIQNWSQQGFFLQHFFDVVAVTQIELYEGDGIAAYRNIRGRWQSLQNSQLLKVAFSRIITIEHLARAAIAHLVCNRDHPHQAQRDALRSIKKLERERPTWSHAYARFLRSQLAYLTNDDDVVEKFEFAAQTLVTCDMRFQATAALACYQWVSQGSIDDDVLRAPCLANVKKPLQFLTIFAPVLRRMVGI